ncbi:hypothetical protein MAR_032115 [Mya arenaria]|uniref:Uncharacterized protein n=1 Tax=Mya arenaria TaxID=6604 RepID=A0ABY7F940_MYAAR|nr:hypothetical protein MAR_032115 [Mya arenaria]
MLSAVHFARSMRLKMVICAKAVVAKENANARQTGGGKPLPVPDDTTLAIIQDMKGTPAFSGIPGSSASESAIEFLSFKITIL